MINILIIEDDAALSKGIALALKDEQHIFYHANDIKSARNLVTGKLFDLIILDVMLPDGNGLDFLTEIRRNSSVPVIVLTANDLETDIVTGLELGADDYITKPFSLMVLRARVKTQLRKKTASDSGTIQIDNFSFNFDNMDFTRENTNIELSKTEQKLLKILLENRGKTVPRDMLIDRVWTDGAEFVDENALSVTIKRLRDKLEDKPSKPEYIKTIYGIGYTWVVK